MTDATDNQPITETVEVELHLFGSPSEVEAQAAQLRELLKVVDESDLTSGPDSDDPDRVLSSFDCANSHREKMTIYKVT